MNRLFLYALCVCLNVGCRSGHFENKGFSDTSQALQATPVSSENIGACVNHVENCQRIEISLQLVGTHHEPLVNHPVEISISHPELLSTTTFLASSDSNGMLRFPLEFKLGASSLFQTIIQFKSGSLGHHYYLASINARSENKPLVEWKRASSDSRPETQSIVEKILCTPISLTTVGQVEKSAQVLEFTLEHRALISSQDEPRLKRRKVFYHISFLNSSLKPLVGSTTTNDVGEALISFPILFRPYDHESNFEVKVAVSLSEDPSSNSAEWSFLMNFDRDPLMPLLSYFTESHNSTVQVLNEPQRLGLKSFNLEEVLNSEVYEMNESRELDFTQNFRLTATVSMNRNRIGRKESEYKALARVKVRGKVFIVTEKIPGSPETIFEQNIETVSNGSGDIEINVQPKTSGMPLHLISTQWILALELPEFPKVDKAFFVADLQTSRLNPLSKNQAITILGNRIYDLSAPAAQTQMPSKSTAQELSAFYPKAAEIKNPPADFEARIMRASQSRDLDIWKILFESIATQLKSNGVANSEVLQVDLIQKVSSIDLLEKKEFSTHLQTENHAEVRAEIHQYLFKMRGQIKKCFVFMGTQQLYFCLPNSVDFEMNQMLSLLTPFPGEYAFRPVKIYGATNFSLSIPEIERRAQGNIRPFVQKLFPPN